jgi:uracil-DNA glycosylase family 4
VSTDEIYERYLQKAITEINELGDEIARAAGETHFPVVGSGHPLADIFLLKYGPQASEAQEGVSFYGRAGQAIIKSLQRLNVDALAVYGTNCLKFAGQKPEQARSMLIRELHIVQPKLIVLMGDDTRRFLNELDFPLSDRVESGLGELQRFTPTIDALVVPDIDASLDEQ